MSYYFSTEYHQKFKVGDYFYFDSGHPKKLKPQEVINIKLGIKNVLSDIDYKYSKYMRQITSIDDDRLYYVADDNIEVR